ncbi:MAG: hypothetical protein DYG89_01980 [Caldilinea sp. CFX5]|nr:hypothetical protein [Caldilinea sp. CFX5]
MKREAGVRTRIQATRIGLLADKNSRCLNPRLSAPLKSWLLALLLLTACALPGPTPTPVAVMPVSALRIAAPPRLPAGAPLTVLVHVTPATATGPVFLTVQGTFGFLPQVQQAVDGVARFPVMLVHTQFAGAVRLRATVGAIISEAEIHIVPGPAVDPILPLVGPRTIVTGGAAWAMAVATPRDALNNPVAENTLVTVRVQHPTGPTEAPATGVETLTATTQNLLAWTRIYSRNRAGPMRIAVTADFGHSPERVVLATPDRPMPFQLLADQTTLPADGRQLVRISSTQLADRFGNVLLDGAHVTLLATMGDEERRSLPATTIDGRIYTTLQAPSVPGQMTVQGWIAGVVSEPLTLSFTPGPAVQAIPVVTKKSAEGIQVIAGPLLGELGQFIPDGAAVTFTIRHPDGQHTEIVAYSDYGYAQILLRRLSLVDGDYHVAVLAGSGRGAVTFPVAVAAW